ncbi:tyrosine-type recombinase/integrase [Salmonella enterica subsp. enterica serovar Champaign]|nr:tyrosine-type recombinase/integrase [Salmonella enterica subsp. enterica serovar Champaign]HDC2548032.1 tyrosine-type recombinase/integrase [Salmonella enterica]HDC2563025.1 tyrosine-type recombinase/integrase [Salmonella enterica]
MPVLFRTIYACGLRCSEARLLRAEEVDLATGVLLNRDAKGGKDRQISVSESIHVRLAHYYAQFDWMGHEWFFHGRRGYPLKLFNVYKNFRRFLWQARISHGYRGHGSRVHDFRHSFAVHNLWKWFVAGKDVGAMLPILQTCMGHYSIADTAYYLRLTLSHIRTLSRDWMRRSVTLSLLLRGNHTMATDFALLLQRFLTSHLAGLRGASTNTVASCRDTFKFLITYTRDQKTILPEKLILSCIDVEMITGFLNWLESSRQNSASTRNQRLAASSCFTPGCNRRSPH